MHTVWQVVGWGDSMEELASDLAQSAVEGTQVTVTSPERPSGLPQGLSGSASSSDEGFTPDSD